MTAAPTEPPKRSRAVWPEATIIQGTGTLFWAGGMALAERSAVRIRPDYLLWLNDDTLLDPDALPRLLAVSRDEPAAIVVGATVDPETGEGTYGGRTRIDYHPQRLTRLPLATHVQRADTFNGNVLLVPWSARVAVDPSTGHSLTPTPTMTTGCVQLPKESRSSKLLERWAYAHGIRPCPRTRGGSVTGGAPSVPNRLAMACSIAVPT